MFRSDVLDHSKGHEGVGAATNIAVILFNKLDLGGEALFFGPCPGEHNLFVRDVECLHSYPVAFGHV